MSLINEALKKAQRVRTGDLSDALPPMPGGSPRIAKRSQPRTSQQFVLIAAGIITLIVLSVVVTVFWVNRPSEPKPAVAAVTKPSAAAATPPSDTPAPMIVVPLGPKPPAAANPGASTEPPSPTAGRPEKSGASSAAAAAPLAGAEDRVARLAPDSPAVPAPLTAAESRLATAVARNDPAPTLPPPAPTPASPTAAAAAPTLVPAAAAPAKIDERTSQFVDAIRVAGVRASGGDSRVLLNDRVYRVNDIVERNFGLRLTRVESSSLTFVDANGAVYEKRF